MCLEIQIKNGPRLERMGDLRALVGHENVVMTHQSDFPDGDCLCHVDVEKTASRSGYHSRPGWDEESVDFIWDAPLAKR